MMREQIGNNILETYFKELSIQIKLSGLSFCVFNPILNCIETIHTLTWEEDTPPKSVEAKIIDFLNTESAVRQDFSVIRVMHSNSNFTLIPKALYNENSTNHYLKYNTKVFSTDEVACDEIVLLDLVLGYVPFTRVNKILLNHFGNFGFEHSASVLLRSVLPHKASHGKSIAYAHIEKDFFYLVVFRDNKLIFFNQFQHHTVEDFLYYLLFSFEQLGVDTEVIPLYLMGNIHRRMPLYAGIYKYVRNVYFFISLYQKPFCQDMDDDLVRNHFLLTHLF